MTNSASLSLAPSVPACADCGRPFRESERGYKVGSVGFWRRICGGCWVLPRVANLRLAITDPRPIQDLNRALANTRPLAASPGGWALTVEAGRVQLPTRPESSLPAADFCSCESSLCDHTNPANPDGKLYGEGMAWVLPCKRVPTGKTTEDWIGDVCETCASNAAAAGFGYSIHRWA